MPCQASTPPRKKRASSAADDLLQKSSEKGPKPDVDPAADDKGRKRRKAGYDIVSNQNKMLQKIKSDLADAFTTGIRKAIEECEKSVQEYQDKYSQSPDASFFDGYVKIVLARKSLASAVLSVASDGQLALATLVEKQVKDKLLSAEDALTTHLLTVAVEQMRTKADEAKDEDGIKMVVKDLKNCVANFKRLTTSVIRAASDLQKAIVQKNKKAEADVAKKRKQEEAQKKKDVKEMQKRVKQGHNVDALPGLWVEGPLTKSLCSPIPTFDDLAAAKKQFKAGGCLENGEPYLLTAKGVETVKAELGKDTIKGFMQIFETQFPLSKQARERGRVQSVMKIDGACKLKEALLSFVSDKCSGFKAEGPNADMEQISAYGFTAAMKYSGAELLGMSAIRYAVKGDREIVLCNAATLWPLIRDSNSEEAAQLSAEKVVTSFLGDKLMNASLEDPWATTCGNKEDGKIMWRGVVPEGSIFVVPAGVILMERSLNNKICMGLRLSLVDKSQFSIKNLQTLLGVHSTYAESSDKLVKRWQDVVSHGADAVVPAV